MTANKLVIRTMTVLSDRLPNPSGVDGRVLTEEGGVALWHDPAEELPALSGVDGRVLTERAGDVHWETPPDLNDKVRTSAADTTSGYLQSKLAAGNAITLTVVNPGGNEQLRIDADVEQGPPQAGLTVAVSPTGSDTPSEDRPAKLYSGNYSAYPFLTIQAALDAIPETLRATTVINIAAGTYAGFHVEGFVIRSEGVLNINGSSTVLSSGTSTSVSGQKILYDTTKNWTPDAYIGKFLYMGMDSWPIIDNDATSITIAGKSGSLLGGTAYSIKGPSAIITGLITVDNNRGTTPNLNNLQLNEGIFVTNSPVNLGAVLFQGGSCYAANASYLGLATVSIMGPTLLGAFFEHIANVSIHHVLVSACPEGCRFEDVQSCGYFELTTMGSGVHGLILTNLVARNPVLQIEALNNTLSGLKLEGARLGNVGSPVGELFGTGNGEYGVAVDSFSELIFSGIPTITGTSGNVQIGRGAAALTWAVDFNDDGDAATNSSFFCRAERKD